MDAAELRAPRRSGDLCRAVTSGCGLSLLVQTEALEEYDLFSHISQRRYVPPNFAEIRHILNISQVHASAEHMQLITFDADGTLYEVRHRPCRTLPAVSPLRAVGCFKRHRAAMNSSPAGTSSQTPTFVWVRL